MRHIVFDFDGPIFDGRKAAETALRETVQHFATQFGEPSLSVTGLPLYGPKRMISTLYTDFGVHERGTIQEFYEERLQQIERAIGIPPAVRSQLDRLIEGGFKIALYSARLVGNLQPLLHDLGLATYFGVPELGCMPKYRKPSGDFLKCVAAHYGVPPKEVLFIGDSDWDYRAAKDAGAVYYHAAWTREPTAESARHASVAVNSLDELLDLLRDATIYKDFTADESALWDSVRLGAFSFYAGAGISVPSNIGGWESHYRPLLARVGAGYLSSEADLPETLQVLSARTARAQRMFDEFRDSFKKTHVRPNAYHFAMLRSAADHVWTSNYDDLFEKANNDGRVGRCVVRNDETLLKELATKLVIKMNGDFESAHFRADLDWGLVFLQEQFDRAEIHRAEIWRRFEDDYRNKSLIFVGMSFRDPVLRRIVAVARQKILRTKRNHFIITKTETEPASRIRQVMFAENLERASIYAIFKDTYEQIIEFVLRIAMVSCRPIIGFSGDVGQGISEKDADTVLDGLMTTPANIATICECLGRELARKGFRVTSGCAPFVGIAAVEAAFELDQTRARFYLRRRGGSRYEGRAQAIVALGTDYASMRQRFIPELSALIAIGGRTPAGQVSGTIQEVEMALDRGIPVVLVASAGGDVKAEYARLRNRMNAAYPDASLRRVVTEINDECNNHSANELIDFARDVLPSRIEKIVSTLAGATGTFERPAECIPW
ncbi:MAG: SIR2 family protein [Acidobacteriia bacterium]|nr:SIR2 family protein [Terriglobia bacterium]